VARPEVAIVGLMTALAAALRFSTLGVQEFWVDERFTVALLDLGLSEMMAQIPDQESTPPLYYVIAWLWTRVVGTSEVGVRSLSALVGTATVPAVYAAARELCDRRTALAASGLAVVSPFLVWYSQEARAYALLVLLGALSLWLLARLLRRWSAHEAAWWALVCALALATHYFALFLIIPQALWLLAVSGWRVRPLLAVCGVGVAGLVLLPLAISQETAGFASFISDSSLARRVGLTAKELALGYDSPLEPVTAAFAVAATVGGIGLALGGATRADRGIWVAATVGAGSIGLPLILAALGTDYVLSRNLIVAWVPLAILVAAGLTRHAGRVGLALLAALCLLGLVTTIGVALEPEWQRGEWTQGGPP
jgi:mannosyltransferase